MYVLNPVMITQSGKGYGQQLLPSYFLSFTCCHCCYQSDFKEASQASPDATVAVANLGTAHAFNCVAFRCY